MFNSRRFITAGFLGLMIWVGAVDALGQSEKTVNAKQQGEWTVRVSDTEAEPLAVKVTPTSRKPFQFRMFVGSGNVSDHHPLPAGKRFVIENISAIARTPPGFKMELELSSYFDANGDGQGDSNDITFHRIALVDQGVFGDMAVATANHKVLVFADQKIGTSSGYGISLHGKISGVTTGFVQGQVTVSGYVEDLPQQ